MIRPKKLCSICRKIKKDDCDRCKPKPFEGISHDNQSFYNSRRWRKLSKEFKRNNPLCIMCLQEGKTTASYYTDHVKPIREGGAKWDINNLQALCVSCHASKSGRDNKK